MQDVKDRIGLYGNATILASNSIIERYIEVSEGVICAETRINWTTGYSSVASHVQVELKSCAASHSAKQILMYDMSGITRAEAITRLNVNQDEFIRTLKAIKDLDTNKMRSVPT